MSKIIVNKAFVLRKICGCNIIMPTGENIRKFQGALILNETSTIIYEQLQDNINIKEIADNLVLEYDVSFKKALEDVKGTVQLLKEMGVVDIG